MTPKQLRDIRSEMGLTQAQIAEATGWSESSICLYENGKRKIPRRFAMAISTVKDVRAIGRGDA